MAEKEPASENPGLIIREEGSDVVEESGAEPAVKAGTLSVVYADGLDCPPRLVLSGTPGVPETLLVVDSAGTPLAQYTAGPVAATRIVGGLLGAAPVAVAAGPGPATLTTYK